MGWNRVMPEVVRGTRTENAEFFCGLQGLAQKLSGCVVECPVLQERLQTNLIV
jgi:hypothetical protein